MGENMLYLKIDVLSELKERGYTTYYLRKNAKLGEQTLQNLRNNIVPGIKSIDILCGLLSCQPADIIGYKPDPDTSDIDTLRA